MTNTEEQREFLENLTLQEKKEILAAYVAADAHLNWDISDVYEIILNGYLGYNDYTTEDFEMEWDATLFLPLSTNEAYDVCIEYL